MTEFSDTQTALTEARKQRNQTNDERFLVAEKLRKIKRRYDERKRRVVGDDDDQLAELKKQATALEQSAERLDARIRESERLLLDQEKL